MTFSANFMHRCLTFLAILVIGSLLQTAHADHGSTSHLDFGLIVPGSSDTGSYTVTWNDNAPSLELQEKYNGGSYTTVYSGTGSSRFFSGKADGTYTYRLRYRFCYYGCYYYYTDAQSIVVSVGFPAPQGISGPANDPDGSFALSWDSVPGATYYTLERRVDNGNWAVIQNGSQTSRAETSLADGVWQYHVRACSPSECSGWTVPKTVNVATPPGVPGLIVGPSSVYVNTGFRLDWGVAPGAVSSYELQQATGTPDNWVTVQNSSALSKLFSPVGAGTYHFRVRACHTVGTYSSCGDWSPIKSLDVGTFIDVGIDSPAYSVTGSFEVTWNAYQGTEFGFQSLQESVDGGAWNNIAYGNGGTYSVSGRPDGSYRYRIFQFETIPWKEIEIERYSYATTTVVGMIPEPPMTGLTVAGSAPYDAGVTKGGNGYINIPIEAAPGVNGLQPSLSLAYSSGRDRQRLDEDLAGDYLGYGWRLAGHSSIRRCVKDRANGTAITLGSGDDLCLNGEPLVLVAGQKWASGSEYRTMRESYHRVVQQSSGQYSWFKVYAPDGGIVEFGKTEDSRLRSVSYQYFNGQTQQIPTLPYLWSVNRQVDAFGNEMSYTYYEDEVAGVSHPATIVYGSNNDARVEFEYVDRDDLEPVNLGGASLDQNLLLHTVRIRLSNRIVREYRLDSETGPQGWRRLNQVQVCGFDEYGFSSECLQPIDVDWAEPSTALPDLKTFVNRLTDSNGMVTEFTHAVMTESGAHPFLFAERPFGNANLPADAQPLTPQADGSLKCVVTEVRRSNGVGGWYRTSYAYQGRGLESTRNWGYLGFYATRETDEQSGVVTYNQFRMDFPHFSEISATQQYDAPFGSHTQLLTKVEVELASIDILRSTGSTHLPYRAVTTAAVIESGSVLGASQHSNFLNVNASGFVDGLNNTITIAGSATPSGSTGSIWGSVPTYTLGDIKRTVENGQQFNNDVTGTNWLVGFRSAVETRHYRGTAASGTLDQTQRVSFERYGNTNVVGRQTNYPLDPVYELTIDNSFDSRGYVESQTVAGVNVLSRTSSALNFVQGRYPTLYRNPLGQDTQVSHDDRFGFEKSLTDPNGRTTQVIFDGFGREVSRTSPDGVVLTTAYDQCSLVACASVNGVVPVMRVRSSSAVSPTTSEYFDVLGRIVRTETESFNGAAVIRQDAIYDDQGRLDRISQPYLSGSTAHYTSYDYDLRNRIERVDRPDGGHTTVAYSPEPSVGVRMTVSENVLDASGSFAETQVKVNKFNIIGELVSTTDGYGSVDAVISDYAYYGTGLTRSATVDTGGAALQSNFAYDNAGLRTSVTGPDIGTVTFDYTALGELREQRDNAQNVITFGYDLLGRIEYQSDPDDTATWTYDAANGIGALASRTYGTGFAEYFIYNDDSRVQFVLTMLQGGGHSKTYAYTYSYDSFGRLDTVRDPSTKEVRYGFNARGYLESVTDTSTNTVLKSFTRVDAYGNVTQEQYGNGVQTARVFDPGTGRITDIDTTVGGLVIQNDEYRWQSNNILESRVQYDGGTTRREEFAYDSLNRLDSANTFINASQSASRSLTSDYDLRGNLLYKTSSVAEDSSLTGYQYTPGTNRLTNVSIDGVAHTLYYDPNGNIERYDRAGTGDDKFITWNARNLPTSVVVGSSPTDPNPTASDEFAYGPSGQRYYKRSTWDGDGTQWVEHTFYVGDFEELLTDFNDLDHKAVQKSRIGSNILHVRTIDYFNVADSSIEYLHRDHLGSVESVTDESGQELRVLAYDPFGERRHEDWLRQLSVTEIYALSDDLRKSTSRGFTGHENLDRTGFVHMNGRIYDPVIGRFLSPDPFVQAPAYSQSWNRYSYVMNSPVSFNDPSGFFRQPSSPNDFCAASPVCMNLNDDPNVGGSSRTVGVPFTRTIIFIEVISYREFYYQPGFGGGDVNGGPFYGGYYESRTRFRVLFFAHRIRGTLKVQVPDDTPTDEPLRMTGAEVGRFENEIQLAKDIGAGIFNEFVVAPIKDFAEGKILSGACRLVKICSAGKRLAGAGKKLFNKVRGRAEPPNPGGRLGKPDTREHVSDVADELEGRGYEITGGGGRLPEEYLPGPGGGRAGSNFPDITATRNGRTVRVNTVDTLRDGVTPSAREARAAAQIRDKTPGDHLVLIPKPK